MNCSTGAPPDYYAKEGQNWGFPTYNWEEMAKDGFLWWRQRLQHMAQYVQPVQHPCVHLRVVVCLHNMQYASLLYNTGFPCS